MSDRFQEDINKIFQEYIHGYWGNRETIMSHKEDPKINNDVETKEQLVALLEKVNNSIDPAEKIDLINKGFRAARNIGTEDPEVRKIEGKLEAIHWTILSQGRA